MNSLLERLRERDERALARAVTLIENGDPEGQQLLAALRTTAGGAHVVGVTGSPGSGKSTLTDRLIGALRAAGERVAVVAVDPTSPFSGGAILGDRIRMTRWHDDRDVYVRSMATRGHLGGLAGATLQVVALLDATGFDVVVVETVGVGQSEIDIVRVADTTLLVMTPGAGDAVQAFKAGVMEIADLFVVNKFDLPGGARLKREIRAVLELDAHAEGWRPPVLEATASQGEGIDGVVAALREHRAFLSETGSLAALRRERVRFEIQAAVAAVARRLLAAHEERVIDAVLGGDTTVEQAVAELMPQASRTR